MIELQRAVWTVMWMATGALVSAACALDAGARRRVHRLTWRAVFAVRSLDV